MTRLPLEEPPDERLRHLLAVEARLDHLVTAAREEADRRMAAEREAGRQRREAARAAVEREDADRARTEHAAHVGALAAVERAHRDVLAAIAGVPDALVDQLARRAVARAIDPHGDAA
jgi:hypothetical protein